MPKFLTPGLMLRLCLMAVIWGGVVFGTASVVRALIQSHLPGMEGLIKSYVLNYQQALEQSGTLLDDLLADGRLTEALQAIPAKPVKGEDQGTVLLHRVLYEYRYLHPDSQLLLYDAVKDMPFRVEGGPDVLPNPLVLSRFEAGADASWLAGNPAAPLLVTARAVPGQLPGQRVYGILGQPLTEVFRDVALPSIPGAQGSKGIEALLANRVGDAVWVISPGQAGRHEARLDAVDLDRAGMTPEQDSVMVVRPLPGLANWAVVLDIPLALVSDAAVKLRTLIWGTGVALTLLILGGPWLVGFVGRMKERQAARPATPAASAPGVPAVKPRWGMLSVDALLGPLQRAIQHARQGEPLIEPDLPPVPEPSGAGLGYASGGGKAGGARRAGSVGGGGGSSVHQQRRRMEEIAPTRPEPVPDPAPQLSDEEIRLLVREALANDLLQLAYQPIYQASDSTPCLHEVYVRLPGKDGGMQAQNFLPQAARVGLLPQIDAQVFKKVMKIHFEDAVRPATPLALNLSADTLDGLGYLEELLGIDEPRILENLIFEVRSGELLKNQATLAYLRRCQQHGIRLAVDYFGGGKTMLEATKQLGFDFVKLDALQFWFDLPKRKELVGLARVAAHIKLPMILEKIENAQMEVMARKVGIPYLQGYHLQRPGPTLANEKLGWKAPPAEDAAPPSEPAES